MCSNPGSLGDLWSQRRQDRFTGDGRSGVLRGSEEKDGSRNADRPPNLARYSVEPLAQLVDRDGFPPG